MASVVYPINKILFYKKYVMYASIVKGTNFTTTHDRTGLTDGEAKVKFTDEHFRQVTEMIIEKKIKEEQEQLQEQLILKNIQNGKA